MLVNKYSIFYFRRFSHTTQLLLSSRVVWNEGWHCFGNHHRFPEIVVSNWFNSVLIEKLNQTKPYMDIFMINIHFNIWISKIWLYAFKHVSLPCFVCSKNLFSNYLNYQNNLLFWNYILNHVYEKLGWVEYSNTIELVESLTLDSIGWANFSVLSQLKC